MAEVQKSPAVEKAEQKLKDLERFEHMVADANTALRAAELAGDPKRVVAAQADYDAAVQARDNSGVTPRAIAEASQEVLDARGETHTEENILPPDHGLRTVEAESALADALGRRKSPRTIAVAENLVAEAAAADAQEKADHVAASHERTMARLEGDQP